MKEIQNQYVRRSQKDYPLSLKLKIVSEIENGHLNLSAAQQNNRIKKTYI